jgi:Spy/CpxP family protein refolding chaperone
MRRIQRELRRQNWERMGQLMEAMEDLHELMASESPDPAAVGQAHARMAELKRPMIEARVKAMNEMRACSPTSSANGCVQGRAAWA